MSNREKLLRTSLIVLKTLAIALAAGIVFSTAGVPLPWILGPLFSTIVASQLAPPVYMPGQLRLILQPILGVFFGSYFTPSLIATIGSWPTILGLLAGYVAVATLFGIFYWRTIGGFDRITAFFASVPGGFGDLTILGATLGANLTLVSLVHSIRLLVVIGTMPFILALFAAPSAGTYVPVRADMHAGDLAILAACAPLGYFAGRLVRMPVAPMFGPLILSALVHVLGWTQSSPPGIIVNVVQIVLGAFIGANFVILNWRHFGKVTLHSVVCALALIVLAMLFAYIASLVSDYPFHYLLLAFSPGGLAEMGLLALSLGFDVALITICHVARLLLVFAIIPFTRSATKAPDAGQN